MFPILAFFLKCCWRWRCLRSIFISIWKVSLPSSVFHSIINSTDKQRKVPIHTKCKYAKQNLTNQICHKPGTTWLMANLVCPQHRGGTSSREKIVADIFLCFGHNTTEVSYLENGLFAKLGLRPAILLPPSSKASSIQRISSTLGTFWKTLHW